MTDEICQAVLFKNVNQFTELTKIVVSTPVYEWIKFALVETLLIPTEFQ